MELLNTIFRLGVVFAIFGFIWGLFQLGYFLLRGATPRNIGETYLIKMLKYFFLVDVTFLFTTEANNVNFSQLIITGLILVAYFVGELQNQQKRMVAFQLIANGIKQEENNFNLKAEIAVISFSMLLFISFIFYPELSFNPISQWFHKSILNIEDTPVFGFIFKVIGFFFVVNILLKMVNSIGVLLSGKPFIQSKVSGGFHQKDQTKKDDDSFDDYEEIL